MDDDQVKRKTFKDKIKLMYPNAICKRESGVFRVRIEGKVVAGGPTAALAWKFAFRKIAVKLAARLNSNTYWG